MRLKHIQYALSSVPIKQFPEPKIQLEQYATSAELASYVIHYALTKGDIGPNDDYDEHDSNSNSNSNSNRSNSVLDLGCGTGMLAMGCAIVGTKHIICVDCDEDAIAIAKDNVEAMELEEYDDDDDDDDDDGDGGSGGGCVIEFVLAQVKHIPRPVANDGGSGGRGRGRGGRGRGRGRGRGKGGRGRGKGGRFSNTNRQPPEPIIALPNSDDATNDDNNNDDDDGIPLSSNCVDTVLTNPPFGTKHNAGIDVTFLKTAIRLATKAVYSFHKSSTSRYLIKIVQSWGYDVEIVAQMKFEIPKMYKFHKQNEVDVEVDLIRVNVNTVSA